MLPAKRIPADVYAEWVRSNVVELRKSGRIEAIQASRSRQPATVRLELE